MFRTFYLDIKMQMCTMSHPSLNHDYQNSWTMTCDVAYYLIVAWCLIMSHLKSTFWHVDQLGNWC